jgi:hypothetical protein
MTKKGTPKMNQDLPSEKELVELYARALKSGNGNVATMAASALQALARVDGAVAEARRLAVLANEL